MKIVGSRGTPTGSNTLKGDRCVSRYQHFKRFWQLTFEVGSSSAGSLATGRLPNEKVELSKAERLVETDHVQICKKTVVVLFWCGGPWGHDCGVEI